ncbi:MULTISPECIES: DNA polymerase III subunit alpha [Bosea]|uniref:DNA polymerase III subunit alpha n=1 Tax=Bosea TaxID=85413 RepID=UPI00214FC3B9|nr:MULTISPECIES: DNA polymerase III subunit alpha [Bosea]MCR4521854.1 DNA polymerase III subunit alpha [Bosea sp. 47.2.35]MDR6827377.1 DNA polymerase-3 subunit alpha [Bosea robiniae]MDR6894087.1 DNA polymerase-3 subunit alpha [Bosea sp. BE109]MDR7137482.1 DNA polymerase-3 subunit alpha [Bosea sp. BE168]MDR7174182.1 DNA polymerase-3 subunit alpha [Bosea sp. BE271]
MSREADEARVLQEIGFVHLHVHSSYSLLEGAMTIATLAKMAVADGQPALALTDTDNLFGGLEFSEKLAGSGLQPIVGVQLSVDFADEGEGSRKPTQPQRLPHIVLLAMDEGGYGNLMKLVSEAALATGGSGQPITTVERLAAYNSGLIALTGGQGGPVDVALRLGQLPQAASRLATLAGIYGDRLYVEIQRHGGEGEATREAHLLRLAYDADLPIVATNEPFFAKPADFDAHDALLAVAEGRLVSDGTRRRVTPEHYFASRAEMKKRFADLPEALANTVEIAMRCHWRVSTRKPILPRFGEEGRDEAEELQDQARAGLAARLAKHGPAEGFTVEDYEKRLDFELSIITRMKFPGYFLIVSDFIKWAKNHDIPVGPGRGSGAGSLVAYALTITDVDPLRFGLLFERFLNPDRVSMPDFDIDFCQNRREEVIDYVKHHYGQERVAQIITFGTLLARGVLRDVGRVLEMPYGQVDKLTKLVPQNPAKPISLKDAIEGEPKLQQAAEEEPIVARLLEIGQKLEGLHRHASTHAAGVVIGDRPLEQLVALSVDPRTGMRVTQFNMKWVEQAGLVKFDFLGLKTLTTLTTAVKLIAQRGIHIDLAQLPFDDPTTYAMLARGETVGVFQVESVGMRKALVEMKADRIEDLIALVALYRPGPMDNIPTYCRRKLGLEDPTYLHPGMEPWLRETHGIIVYQEQVMQVAQALSGYSLGEADLLRRAMGKKIKAEMDAQRDRFVKGAIEGGIKKDIASEIFDLLAKFADYGFNKSHAAAYAIVAFQTAYLKANYPVEFLAASMTLDMGNTDKLSEFRRDAERLGIKVERPAINQSGVEFDVADGKIFYALGAIKGVGTAAVESLVAARQANGPFRDLADLARRIDTRLVNRRTLEALIAAGALDELEADRARAVAALDGMLALSNRTRDEAAAGQFDLLGGGVVQEAFRIPQVEPWAPAEKLRREHEAVGFFLSGHPLDDYEHVLKRLRVQRYADFAQTVKVNGTGVGKVAVSVIDKSERRTKSGSKMGIVNLSDPSGQFEAVLFSEGLMKLRDLLEPGRALVLRLSAVLDGEEVRPRIEDAEELDGLAARQKQDLVVYLRDDKAVASVAERIRPRDAMRAEGKVSIIMIIDDGAQEVEIELPGKFPVNQQIANAVRAAPGVVDVRLQ